MKAYLIIFSFLIGQTVFAGTCNLSAEYLGYFHGSIGYKLDAGNQSEELPTKESCESFALQSLTMSQDSPVLEFYNISVLWSFSEKEPALFGLIDANKVKASGHMVLNKSGEIFTHFPEADLSTVPPARCGSARQVYLTKSNAASRFLISKNSYISPLQVLDTAGCLVIVHIVAD